MRIGVLGGGQLGRMLALAGYPLGFRFVFFDDSPDACAGQVGELRSADALTNELRELDIITYEFENVMELAAVIDKAGLPLRPNVQAIVTSSDRISEKQFFRSLGIETASFVEFVGADGLDAAISRVNMPCVAKTSRLGYDGKGQAVIRSAEDVLGAKEVCGDNSMILEELIEFDRELSIIAVRSTTEMAFYPLVENHHAGGVLRKTIAPAPFVDASLQEKAEDYARLVMEELDYIGVLTIELFERDGRLLANEMAPRVHNSGHWTIDGAMTSQFENHLRAITGLPIGSTQPREKAVMVNLIGGWPEPAEVLAIEGARLHLYGKEPRPGRKVGHVTILGADAEDERVRQMESLLS